MRYNNLMNAVDLKQERDANLAVETQSEHGYRSISKAAVACLVFGILSLLSFVGSVFVILPVFGLCFGLLALSNLKRFPNELIGRKAARVGTIVNLVCLLGSVGFHSYIYATEVPEGYQRMTFWDLQPDKTTQLPFSEKAKTFDGKKVFLKGYVRPGAKQKNLQKFILVGDFGSCCFGGNPEITDIVSITIDSDQTVDYSLRLRRVTGKFKLNPKTKHLKGEKDIPSVYYEIIADNVK
jgi:hypothetical protein